MKVAITIEDMRAIAAIRGGLCLSPVYFNDATNLEWKCAQRHVWKATPNNVKKGTWCRICAIADSRAVLPIQGPPGAGKTYIGARMICELVGSGKKVGITAVSHKVIRKLLDETILAAAEERLEVRAIQKVAEKPLPAAGSIVETDKNAQVLEAIQSGEASIAAGTACLYSLNRFNVASSRARCACILVASPRIFQPECKTPRQMKLANVLCRYREMAKVVVGF